MTEFGPVVKHSFEFDSFTCSALPLISKMKKIELKSVILGKTKYLYYQGFTRRTKCAYMTHKKWFGPPKFSSAHPFGCTLLN